MNELMTRLFIEHPLASPGSAKKTLNHRGGGGGGGPGGDYHDPRLNFFFKPSLKKYESGK
jgi:hypothetical protein